MLLIHSSGIIKKDIDDYARNSKIDVKETLKDGKTYSYAELKAAYEDIEARELLEAYFRYKTYGWPFKDCYDMNSDCIYIFDMIGDAMQVIKNYDIEQIGKKK